jgi:predicted dehydrogenase
MSTRLRVGIIGVGHSWPRWHRALQALRGVLEPHGICDQLPARAERAARQLGCRPAAGPSELVHRDEVDAVLLLARQWFGLWPLTLAASLGKPVYCAVSLAQDEARVDEVAALVRDGNPSVQMALSPWATPALVQLRERLGLDNGQPLVVRVEYWRKKSTAGPADEPPTRGMPGILDAVAWLVGSPPTRVRAVATPARHFSTFLLDFGEERLAQVCCWHSILAKSGCRFHVETVSESLQADPPGHLSWQDATGRHELRLRHLPWRLRELADFTAALRDSRPPRPDFATAYRALSWARAARRALEQGQPVELADVSAAR